MEDDYITIKIPRDKLTGRPSRRPSDKDLLDYYSKHTREETALHFKVAPSTVSMWLRKAGIKKYAKTI